MAGVLFPAASVISVPVVSNMKSGTYSIGFMSFSKENVLQDRKL